jgi:hypothetical protein
MDDLQFELEEERFEELLAKGKISKNEYNNLLRGLQYVALACGTTWKPKGKMIIDDTIGIRW